MPIALLLSQSQVTGVPEPTESQVPGSEALRPRRTYHVLPFLVSPRCYPIQKVVKPREVFSGVYESERIFPRTVVNRTANHKLVGK